MNASLFTGLNWLAILVAGVASFMLGGLWYAALFGKAWMRAYAFTDDQVKAMSASPARTYTVLFLCDLVFAVGLALLVRLIGVESLADGLVLGAFLAVLIVAPLTLATQIGSARSIRGYAIDFGKHAGSLLLAGAILGAWR